MVNSITKASEQRVVQLRPTVPKDKIKTSYIQHQVNNLRTINTAVRRSRLYWIIIRQLFSKINIKWIRWTRAGTVVTTKSQLTREPMWSKGRITRRARVRSVSISNSLWISKITRSLGLRINLVDKVQIMVVQMNWQWAIKSSREQTQLSHRGTLMTLRRILCYLAVQVGNSKTLVKDKRMEFTLSLIHIWRCRRAI